MNIFSEPALALALASRGSFLPAPSDVGAGSLCQAIPASSESRRQASLYPSFRNEVVDHKLTKSAVCWALDDRTENASEFVTVSADPLELKLVPLRDRAAYASGVHGRSQMEHLRAWAFCGFQHMVALITPGQLRFRLRSPSKALLGTFRDDDFDQERLVALRHLLREQGKQAATRDGAIGLHALFNGEIGCSAGPVPERSASCATLVGLQRRRLM